VTPPIANPVSLACASISCCTPQLGDDSVAAVGLPVPGSLSVLTALEADVLSVPVGRGSPGQVALFALSGALVLDEVHVTLTGVVAPRSIVPEENVPTESATWLLNPA
jgi:hypothetical protein